MRTKTVILALSLLIAASSIALVQATHVFNFTHPGSLPDQASDNARKALADRGTHGHEGTETGDHDDDNESATGAEHEHEHNATDTENENEENENATDVDNNHDVNAGESVNVTHCIENDEVVVYVAVSVTPGTPADTTQSIQHGGIMAQPLGGTLEATC